MVDILAQIQDALVSDSDARRDEALDAAYVEIERLRAALEPFTKLRPVCVGFAAMFKKPDWEDCNWAVGFNGMQPEFRHFEAARNILAAIPPADRGGGNG